MPQSFSAFRYLYNMEYGKIQCSTYAHDDAVSALELNGDLLASASWDSLVKVSLGSLSTLMFICHNSRVLHVYCGFQLWHLDYEKHKVSAELKLMVSDLPSSRNFSE